ncbi:5-phosphohydroxy-L-lysine phospho-lyase-like [Oppia nitens]|uniref:5-phosphohydroxy-L-lysine phospho-lyase-like n=1 Tax=Oppia nitens TaxID=1686743 RepID=UPI0023DC835C|nr:5-phosphohydroxy-L-lysine phospho-lyase-like [Oppia nitens]
MSGKSSSSSSSLEKLPKEVTLKLRKQHIGGSVTLFFKQSPLKIVRGSGQYMYDEEDTEYLDCINNVAHVGHCHPHVVKAGADQMALISTNSRFLHDNMVIYARRLTSYFPDKLSVCYFVNSGSEANDLAMRLARAHTNNKDVITLDGAYHGHLTTTIDISPYKFKKINGGQKKPWVHVVPLPCSYRGKYTTDKHSETEIGQLYAREVQQLINNAHDSGRRIGAFIHESMISCGGQVVLPKHFLKTAYKYVREAGGVCIADEVQVGFGRTGHMWAFETQGVVPDIVTIGKPIGNGHPIACVVTTAEIARSFENIGTEYFNTYGGNPVSLAIANAVLDIIERDQLREHAIRVGKIMKQGLLRLQQQYPIIGDVRGEGLFLGAELVMSRETKEPADLVASYVVARFKDEKMLMSTEGKYDNVLKFKPPMVFTEDNARQFLQTFETILKEIYNDDNSGLNGLSLCSSGGSSVISSSSSDHSLVDEDSDQSDDSTTSSKSS